MANIARRVISLIRTAKVVVLYVDDSDGSEAYAEVIKILSRITTSIRVFQFGHLKDGQHVHEHLINITHNPNDFFVFHNGLFLGGCANIKRLDKVGMLDMIIQSDSESD